MELPHLDESGVYTFENTEEQPPLSTYAHIPSDDSEIDESLPSRDKVLETIVTSRELACGANLEGRIARLSQEIEELKAEVGEQPVETLEHKLAELKVKKKLSLYNPQPHVPVKYNRESLEKLSQVETRISQLENVVGPQRPPISLMKAIQQLKQKVDLLALSPEHIEASVAALQTAQLPLDKVDTVYNRLECLGPLLDSLPQVVARLRSLEMLHIDAAVSQGFIKDAEGTLRQMQSDIKKWQEKLDLLESAMKT